MKHLLTFLLFPVAIFVHGIVLRFFWAWFFVSAFHVAQISIAQSVGISQTVAFMVIKYGNAQDREWSGLDGAERLATQIAMDGIALGVGWIVHLFA